MNEHHQTSDPTLTFAALARSFLSSNPRLLDTLVSILHSVADELDGLKTSKMISSGSHMSPSKFKQRVIDKVMKKLGYNAEDISDLCNQGRADEILQEIDRMVKPSLPNTVSPSRRVIPAHGSSSRFEDVTDGSRKSTRSSQSSQH